VIISCPKAAGTPALRGLTGESTPVSDDKRFATPAQMEVGIFKQVSYEISGIRLRLRDLFVPAAFDHPRGKSRTQELKSQMDVLRRNQTGSGHSMIAFDDGQRTLFIQSMSSTELSCSGALARFVAQRSQFGDKCVRRNANLPEPNVIHHFRQIKIPVGEFAQ